MFRKVVAAIREQSIPLDDPSAFDRLLQEAGDAQIVMIGEQYGKEKPAVGFGTFEGTVIAGSSWGETPEEMIAPPVPPPYPRCHNKKGCAGESQKTFPTQLFHVIDQSAPKMRRNEQKTASAEQYCRGKAPNHSLHAAFGFHIAPILSISPLYNNPIHFQYVALKSRISK
ncbi:hypothetical protein [Sporosarcina sp.]|uniref:hypothetical protein n=1 Tax=Sporosarcina sp. TaxID=49982 RepID=UPI0026159D9A|nr:hypothetical protein [Sporosarcina sp.]